MGFTETGLSNTIGDALQSIEHLPLFFIVLFICLVVTFTTELVSNVATANIMLPIIGLCFLFFKKIY